MHDCYIILVMWCLRSYHIPGLAHLHWESGIRGSRLHSRPGAQLPAVYVGGQKQLPQDSPSCFKPKITTSIIEGRSINRILIHVNHIDLNDYSTLFLRWGDDIVVIWLDNLLSEKVFCPSLSRGCLHCFPFCLDRTTIYKCFIIAVWSISKIDILLCSIWWT